MTWLPNLICVCLIGFIIWWFWLSRPQTQRVSDQAVIDIVVENGVYTPARIEVPVGKAVTLRFLRKDPSPCAEKVLFDTLGVAADLAIDNKTDVIVTPQQAGDYAFTCQMQMYRGTLVAR